MLPVGVVFLIKKIQVYFRVTVDRKEGLVLLRVRHGDEWSTG